MALTVSVELLTGSYDAGMAAGALPMVFFSRLVIAL